MEVVVDPPGPAVVVVVPPVIPVVVVVPASGVADVRAWEIPTPTVTPRTTTKTAAATMAIAPRRTIR